MNPSRISRLRLLLIGFTLFELSTNMAQADTDNPVVSATSVTYNTSNEGTNGSPYQSKIVFGGYSTLNWNLGQPSGATSGSSTLGYSWIYPAGGWHLDTTYVTDSITDWPTGTTGTVATTSYSATPMTNSTTSSSSAAAAYVPPTNNWEYAFGDVQVTFYPSAYNPTATNTTTKTASAILHLDTNGGTNYGWSSIFKITASASERAVVVTTNWVNPYYYYLTTNIGSRPIPPANINCGFGTFNTNGVLYTNLNNNTSYPVTPSLPAQYTNYVFNLKAERVIIQIGMRVIGPITPYTTNASLNGMVGPPYYATLTNWFGQSDLGVGPTPQPGYAKSISNMIELTAGVPDDPIFDSGWKWHRDGDGKEYYWSVGGALIDILDSISPTNNPAPPGVGSDDPTDPSLDPYSPTTTSPDAARMLFDHDAPRLITAGPNVNANYADAWFNSVFAKRFNARQWLTWNGVFISNVVEWHSQVTVKKTAPPVLAPWTRVGPNEIGPSLLPSINFTVTEASQY